MDESGGIGWDPMVEGGCCLFGEVVDIDEDRDI